MAADRGLLGGAARVVIALAGIALRAFENTGRIWAGRLRLSGDPREQPQSRTQKTRAMRFCVCSREASVAAAHPLGFGQVEVALEVAVRVDHAPLLAGEHHMREAGLVQAAL
jgi:hypothetical protein